MVERSIAWLTRGNRKLRYRGVIKNDHWLHHRAAVLNLRRLVTLGLDHDGTAWVLLSPTTGNKPLNKPTIQGQNRCDAPGKLVAQPRL